MYRPEIKVLDCTIRDGGLINNHDFEERFVREVVKALATSGVDYMEVGYKNSKNLFSEKDEVMWHMNQQFLVFFSLMSQSLCPHVAVGKGVQKVGAAVCFWFVLFSVHLLHWLPGCQVHLL